MRSGLLAAGGAALLGLSLVAVSTAAPGDDQTIDSALKPSSSAKVGDWVAFRGEIQGLTTQPGARPFYETLTVDEIAKDGVIVSTSNNWNGDKPRENFKFKDPGKLAPWLRLVLNRDRDPHCSEVKHGNSNQKIGNKDFSCRKLTFHASLFTDQEFDCDLSISTDVKSLGLVVLEMRQKKTKGGKPELVRRYEIVGYGTVEKTEWGNTAAELLARPAKIDNDAVLPMNPFAKVKAGEWVALRGRPKYNVNAREIPDSTFLTFTVEKVEPDKVTIVSVRSDSRTETKTVFSKKDTPTLAAYLSAGGLLDDPWITDLTTTDDTRAFLDKEFACKKISYTTVRARIMNESIATKNTLWLSDAMPSFAMVALASKGDRLEFNYEVVGWRSEPEPGKPVTVGQTADEAEKQEKAEKEKAQPKTDK